MESALGKKVVVKNFGRYEDFAAPWAAARPGLVDAVGRPPECAPRPR